MPKKVVLSLQTMPRFLTKRLQTLASARPLARDFVCRSFRSRVSAGLIAIVSMTWQSPAWAEEPSSPQASTPTAPAPVPTTPALAQTSEPTTAPAPTQTSEPTTTTPQVVPMQTIPTGAEQPCPNSSTQKDKVAPSVTPKAKAEQNEAVAASPKDKPVDPGVLRLAKTGSVVVGVSVAGLGGSVVLFAVAAERERRANYPSLLTGTDEAAAQRNEILRSAQNLKYAGIGTAVASAGLMTAGIWMVVAARRKDRKQMAEANQPISMIIPVFQRGGAGLQWRLRF